MKAVYEKHTAQHYKNSEMPFIFHSDVVSEYDNNYSYLHWHENVEFLYCKSGEGEVFSDAKRIPFAPHVIVTVNSNSPHTIFNKNGDRVEYDCLIVDSDFCKQNGIDLQSVVFEELTVDKKAEKLFCEAFLSCSEEGGFHSLAARVGVLNFLLYMCRRAAKEKQKLPTRSSVPYIKKTVSFIKENYAAPITLRDAAAVSGFSIYYFSREFKSITGHTFTDFLSLIRCDRAESFLSEGMSVTDAAASCGFKDISYFSKTFKRIKGKNPSEIKNKADV
jgi:AraC-like DNA-binding protein